MKEFRAHPIMMIGHGVPFIFILIFPIFKWFSFVLFLIAFLNFRAFSISVGEEIVIKQGFFIKRKTAVPTRKISSVQEVKTPVDAVFRSVTYKINTESGSFGSSDFTFKLRRRDSMELSRLLGLEEAKGFEKIATKKILLLALSASSAVTGILVGLPIINRSGRLLGLALDRMLIERIEKISLTTLFPPLINTASIVLLISYAVAFVYLFLKYINFSVSLKCEKIELRFGFLSRNRTVFKKSAVKSLLVSATPLMRIFKRALVKVSVGGYGTKKGSSSVLIPIIKESEKEAEILSILPLLRPNGKTLYTEKGKRAKRRALFLPTLYFVLLWVAALVLSLIFGNFARLILFLGVISSLFIFYYGYLCLFSYNFGEAILGDNIYVKSIKHLKPAELYCKKEDIGEITVRQTPTDKRRKTCKVIFKVFSESADQIKAKNIYFEELKGIKGFDFGKIV